MFKSLQHRPVSHDLVDERVGHPLWTGPHLLFALSLLLVRYGSINPADLIPENHSHSSYNIVCRQFTQKLLEFKGWKPVMPTNGKGPWEMVMAEWDNMQQAQEARAAKTTASDASKKKKK